MAFGRSPGGHHADSPKSPAIYRLSRRLYQIKDFKSTPLVPQLGDRLEGHIVRQSSGCIAGHDHGIKFKIRQESNDFTDKSTDFLAAAIAVRQPGVITQIYKLRIGDCLRQTTQNRKSAHTGVEQADFLIARSKICQSTNLMSPSGLGGISQLAG